MKDLNKIIKQVNDLQADDYKDYKHEDEDAKSEYERGFNAAVGLCLLILDSTEFIQQKSIETSEIIEKGVNVIINMNLDKVRKACYLIFNQLYTDEQIIELIESRDIMVDTSLVEEQEIQFNLALCGLAIATKLNEKETPKKSKFQERLEIHQKKLSDALNKR